MKLKTLKKFDKPTDILIFGSCEPVDFECDVAITDDYTTFCITNNGRDISSAENWGLESDGFVSIVTPSEFFKMDFEEDDRVFDRGFDIRFVRGFVGSIKLVVKWEDKEYDTIGIGGSEYIHDCKLDENEDFYPEAYIELVSDEEYETEVFTQELYDKLKLKLERKEKLDSIK